ncbi:MAG: hypothetical protein Q7R53_02675 [bacterium]|nr:hypothetical protein [bacterium]
MNIKKRASNKKRFVFLSFLSKLGKFIGNKRQKFIIAVFILSTGMFFSEFILEKSFIFVSLLMSALTVLAFYISNKEDISENFSPNVFILPFFYSLAFSLFYFLIPARFLTRILMTSLYAVGLYSLFLSENIFIVASIRTIALLSSARIVSFVITLVSYFFLSNVIFSFDWPLIPTSLTFFVFSFLLIIQSLWTITLEKSPLVYSRWALGLSLCFFELSLILWFWPGTPTIISLFLTGFFYAIIGLSHAWLEKKLFKNVMWEYIWVGAIVFFILMFFTSWRE